MHVIVVGSGIAGPLTSLALQKAGISSTVYEAWSESAGLAAGAYLTVAVNGLDAMRTLGIHDEVMRAGFPSERIEFVSGSGKILGALPMGGKLDDGTITHTIRRSDLYRIAHDQAVARGIRVEHGKRLKAARVDGNRVTAIFDDGSSATGDLLVGADGIHSRTRQLIDPNSPRPRFTGLGNVGGFTPSSAVDLPKDTYRMVFGKKGFFGYTVSPSGEVWWFANPPWKTERTRQELSAMTTENWKNELCALFDGDQTPAVDIIRGTVGALTGTNQHDMPRVPTWRSERMLIIGDAAHAAAPSSGQGASMAAEDAVTLAICLRDDGDVTRALATFEALRRPRAERVVKHGARASSTKTAGPVGRVIRDAMMPVVFRHLASTSEGSLKWLFQHHIAWEADARKMAA